jgi:hypothetical protein
VRSLQRTKGEHIRAKQKKQAPNAEANEWHDNCLTSERWCLALVHGRLRRSRYTKKEPYGTRLARSI